jgi:hypothetical protein
MDKCGFQNKVRSTEYDVRDFFSNLHFTFCNYQFAIKNVVFLFVSILFLTVIAPATAQEYLFGVPNLKMYVTVQSDSTVKIDYQITFHNNPAACPIDVVDIGTPHSSYNLGDVHASIGGRTLTDIRYSSFVKGFEVHLGNYEIKPGKTDTLKVSFTMPNMIFQDTTRKDYASFRITPTWFGNQYVRGNTHIQVAILLPENIKAGDVLHQGEAFTVKRQTDHGIEVGWDFPAVPLTGPHMVAVSFPKGNLKVIRQTAIDLLLKWFSQSEEARVVCGLIFLVLFAIAFFRFSGGTGFSVFFILSAAACAVFYFSPGWHLMSLPAAVVLIGLNEWLLRKRKMHYMPPIAQVEGGGIKRGLTAPEAAVLLELPIAKVLSLVIFGMLKKGILHQLSADPLTVAVDESLKLNSEELPADEKARTQFYRDAGQKKAIVVHSYEQPFLFLLEKNPNKPVKEIDFGVPVRKLITSAAERMAGFNLRETQDYYRSIIKRAAEQAAAIGDIPQRQATVDRNFEWILMDDDYPTVFTGWPYRPIWTRGAPMHLPGAPSVPTSAPGIPGDTTFKDVAASFSGWAENTMGDMASAIGPGSLSPGQSAGGFLDLSGADRVTGDIFSALAEASTKGGGSGGGGGCACAGCACACACAGGGR